MERLTGWDNKGVFYRHGAESGMHSYADRPPHDCREAIERLAAYEDTGLTPKQIEAQGDKIIQLSMEIAELRESNQALKAYAENIEADKEAQVEKLKLMEAVLKDARTALELLRHMNPKEFCFVFEVRCAIDALLGGKEDA